MFKHYLTYGFALAFHRSCLSLTLPPAAQHRLMRSAEQFMQSFDQAIRAQEPKDQARHWYSAIVNLRDCGEILNEVKAWDIDSESKYWVLHGRLEQLIGQVAERAENGQLRMLG